jgi:FMN phosphatase YigB (HAD superfamily)
VPPIDFDHFEVLTFDCYGTLIDWEAGILAGLRRVLEPRGVAADDDDLLERYDDLFAASNRRLGVTFDWVITAQQVGSYKPTLRNFELAFERIGVPRERILHVAQSLFHDHVPAKRLGMTTVWVDRRHDLPGSGATPPATATPDLTVPDMATLARLAVAQADE